MAAEVISDSGKILSDLKSKRYAPVYFLFGEEHFFIDEISDYIEANVLTEAEKGFNQSVFYGKDADAAAIVASARRFPMMAPYQVIIVKEAQGMDKLEDLESYCEKPVPTTILVICLKKEKFDKRTKLYKSLAGKHLIFESKKLNESKLPVWIEAYLQRRGFRISAKASGLIANSLGSDLSKIVNELEKLIIDKKDEQEITDTDVELKIGISKDFNVFELIGAIANKNSARAFSIAHHLGKSKSFSMVPAVINLNNFFNKSYIVKQSNVTDRSLLQQKFGLNYYQAGDCMAAARKFSSGELEKCIRLMHEYDLKSKGVNNLSTRPDELLKEMLLQIL